MLFWLEKVYLIKRWRNTMCFRALKVIFTLFLLTQLVKIYLFMAGLNLLMAGFFWSQNLYRIDLLTIGNGRCVTIYYWISYSQADLSLFDVNLFTYFLLFDGKLKSLFTSSMNIFLLVSYVVKSVNISLVRRLVAKYKCW